MNLSISQIGISITEGGRHGTFIDSLQTAIKTGASVFELSAHMEGPGVGFESYGRSVRNVLRQITKANNIVISSVHVPSEIANLSGFNGKSGFSDETRHMQMAEVKKAIDFAASVTDSCAVVIHTGEFLRPISEQPFSKDKEGRFIFSAYDEEGERADALLVDKSTGKVVQSVKKNQIVPSPVWNKYEGKSCYVDNNGILVKEGAYVDYEGNKVEKKERVPKYDRKTGTFAMHDSSWKDFLAEAEEINQEFERKNKRRPRRDEVITPEEALLYAQTEVQEKIAKSYALHYGRRLDKQLSQLSDVKKVKKCYDELEASLPENEKWRILLQYPRIGGIAAQIIPPTTKLPSEVLNETIKELDDDVKSTQKLVVGQEQTVRQQQIIREQTVSISKYAKVQSIKSYVQLGLYAMDTSKDIFLAPENIFPEMGYGSHPEELIELVMEVREEMKKHLIKHRNFSETKAKDFSEKHIKATLDTQHLGMWKKPFIKMSGESKVETNKRFNCWYLDQVKKLSESGVIGHVHLVEGFGLGHTHLAAGEGNMPVIEAVQCLKKNGYKGFIISEAYGENFFGQGKQATETWKNLDSSIGHKTKKWKDIDKDYFGKGYGPKPLYDDDLWSGIPFN